MISVLVYLCIYSRYENVWVALQNSVVTRP